PSEAPRTAIPPAPLARQGATRGKRITMQNGRDAILVTGATGQQGGAVARELLAHGHKVRAMTRRPDGESAKILAALGAEIVAADLDDARSLEQALAGVWGVFAVQNTLEV